MTKRIRGRSTKRNQRKLSKRLAKRRMSKRRLRKRRLSKRRVRRGGKPEEEPTEDHLSKLSPDLIRHISFMGIMTPKLLSTYLVRVEI